MASASEKIGRIARGAGRRLKNARLVDRRFAFELWETLTLEKIFEQFNVDCVFDVGANIGQHARMLRSKVGYKGLMVSFEPEPETAKLLRQAAQGDDKWVVEELALSTDAGTSQFNVAYGSEFSSLSKPAQNYAEIFEGASNTRETIEVKSDRLDAVLARLAAKHGFKRPFLKLDTQGFDHAIIMASRTCLKSFVGLQSELAIHKLYQDAVDFRQAITDYESCGFSLCSLVPNNAGHFPRLLEIDCIMLRTDLMS